MICQFHFQREPTITTLIRRILHAILFELGALLMVVPLMSTVLHMAMLHFGALAVMLSVCAMLCNMAYNHAFEWFEKRYLWQRNLLVRTGHAVGFEVFFTLITVPLTAWWLSLSWRDAFLLDLVLTAFFMLYAFCFNWLYDRVRGRVGN